MYETKDSIAKIHTLATLLFAYLLPKYLNFGLMNKLVCEKEFTVNQFYTFDLQILKHKDISLQLGNE